MYWKNLLKKQPWIYSPQLDLLFIIAPPFFTLLVIFIFHDYFAAANVTLPAWIILVLLIDVSHVYSTLYRTYFDKETLQSHKLFLTFLPLCCWIVAILLYAYDSMLFWRCMAYLAVYHFIRQQYGFMKIYSRKETNKNPVSTTAIYSATLYPILHWHLHGSRNFSWFVEGDFLLYENQTLSTLLAGIYFVIMIAYLFYEIKSPAFNLPRNLFLGGTALSWYFGIVYFNSDLIFTALNVIAHGVPYMALIWVYGKKKYKNTAAPSFNRYVFSSGGVAIFLGLIFLLAFVEEGFWDGLVWKDHPQLFGAFYNLPALNNDLFIALVVSLLSVPQITHYVIDGYIWKIKKDDYKWKEVVLN